MNSLHHPPEVLRSGIEGVSVIGPCSAERSACMGIDDTSGDECAVHRAHGEWEEKACSQRLAVVQVTLAIYRKRFFSEIARRVASLALISDTKSSTSVRRMGFNDSRAGVSRIQEYHVESAWIGSLFFQKGLLGILRREPFDAIVLPGTVQFISVWLALLVCRWKGVPVYLWTHGALGHENRVKMALRRLMMRWSDGVLLYGERAKQILSEAGVPARKLHVIHNSVFQPPAFEELFRIQVGAAREIKGRLFPKTAELPVVVFIGRILASKGIEKILNCLNRAIREGWPFNFLCIGDGPSRTLLTAEADALGISEYVSFTGECFDEDEVLRLLALSDVCVYPGSVGLAAIHAMGCGVPVISHNDFSTQKPEFEAILPGITGDFYERGSLDSLGETIQRWLFHAGHDRRGVAHRCWQRVMDNYTTERHAHRFLEAVFGAT